MSDIQALQRLARKVGLELNPKDRVTAITLHGVERPIAMLPVPDDLPADSVPAVPEPRNGIAGWDFSQGRPRFDGTLVPVHGRKAEVLKLLAENPAGISVKRLKAALDEHMEDSTVRWHVKDLKAALANAFPGLEDPIVPGPDGYVLQIR